MKAHKNAFTVAIYHIFDALSSGCRSMARLDVHFISVHARPDVWIEVGLHRGRKAHRRPELLLGTIFYANCHSPLLLLPLLLYRGNGCLSGASINRMQRVGKPGTASLPAPHGGMQFHNVGPHLGTRLHLKYVFISHKSFDFTSLFSIFCNPRPGLPAEKFHPFFYLGYASYSRSNTRLWSQVRAQE